MEVLGNAIVGGMETYVERLISGLMPLDFEFRAVAPFESRKTARLRTLGCPVQVVKLGEEIAWPSLQTLCTLIQLHEIDVLHAHLPQAHALAALAGRLTHRPVLTTIHGRVMSPLDLEVQRLAGTHLCVVHRAAWLHALAAGVSRKRLSLIPNGVDLAQFRPLTGCDELHRRFGLAPDTLLVGFIGRLSEEKGPDVFVRAAAAARDAGSAAHFVLVGEGPQRASLERLVDASRLAGCVHFAGVTEDVAAVLSELALIVSTSHSEGLPLAIMEAMACARPVVCTHVGGNADLVEVGATGFLVPAGDHQAIARDVMVLLEDAALRREYGENARRRAREHFDATRTLDGMAGLLRRLAHRGTTASSGHGRSPVLVAAASE